ncbi:hypothetical protein Arub01_35510 [Actinomadura rubrobrunea]|uniref:Uncharacterized protein n=1 Tax=Actinomadura rubrobrunea TaxID=115335 RepID=A0A9W6PZ10_9ACTN|nr:hypothetical protein Arub01_35510 [Actinomadura rubrobrunea]
MTDMTEFRRAFNAFWKMPFPDRPRGKEFQDWAVLLLILDTHVAGYASRVNSGDMDPRDVPGVGDLLAELKSLRASLETIRPETERDKELAEEYRSYIASLEKMLYELWRLSCQ